jgi:hypothetical protein
MGGRGGGFSTMAFVGTACDSLFTMAWKKLAPMYTDIEPMMTSQDYDSDRVYPLPAVGEYQLSRYLRRDGGAHLRKHGRNQKGIGRNRCIS